MYIVEDGATYTSLNIGQHRWTFSMSCIWIVLRIWKHDHHYSDHFIIIIIVIIQYYLIALYI